MSHAESGRFAQPRPASDAGARRRALRLGARTRTRPGLDRHPDEVASLLAPLARGEASRVSRRASTAAWSVVRHELWITPHGIAWRPRAAEHERAAPVHRIAAPAELAADAALATIAWDDIAAARFGRAADDLHRVDLELRDGSALAFHWDAREAGRPAPPAGPALAAALAERCPGLDRLR